MTIRNTESEINRFRENKAVMRIAQRTTKLSNRLAKVRSLEEGGGEVAVVSIGRYLAGSHATKPAVASMVLFQGLVKLRFAKIRPKRRRDDQFGIGNLPQQKVAHPHLATGPNQ